MLKRRFQSLAEKVGSRKKTEYSPEYNDLCKVYDSSIDLTGDMCQHINGYACILGQMDSSDPKKRSPLGELSESMKGMTLELENKKYVAALEKALQTFGSIMREEQGLLLNVSDLRKHIMGLETPLLEWRDRNKKDIENERKTLNHRRLDMDSAKRKVEKKKKSKKSPSLNEAAQEQVTTEIFQQQLVHLTKKMKSLPEDHKRHDEILRNYLDKQLHYHQISHRAVSFALANF